MDPLIIAVCSFVAGTGLSGLVFYIRGLNNRIAKLEQDGPKHLPYQTADEIEDAIAAILTAKFQNDFRSELFDNALVHLQKARGGNGK